MIRKLLINHNPALVADIGVQGGTVDFRSSIMKLKRTAPDALVIFVWDERLLLSLLQQIRTHLPNVPLVTVHDGAG
jgi:hypothetical protein